MNALLALIRTRVESTIAGLEYPSPDGLPVSPAVYVGAKPILKGTEENSVPFVLIRPLSGINEASVRTLNVSLMFAVYTDADVESGVFYINELAGQLLTMQADRSFAPYVLMLPIKWQTGDADAQQPHPYYYTTIHLTFKAAR